MSDRHLFNITSRLPHMFVRGEDSCLIDSNGKRYIDCWNDEGVASLGYNSREVRNAMSAFMDSGAQHRTPRAFLSRVRTTHAAAVCDRWGYDRVFYANSGAEANETAIKLARIWQSSPDGHGKLGVVTVRGNFHGRTAFAMACSDSTDSPYHKTGYGPMPALFGTIDIALDDSEPHGIKVALVQGASLPPGDDASLTLDKVGAINMAPILGNNCVTTYPRELFQRLRSWCDANGVLLIFDDVQAGAGRCGHYGTHLHPEVDIKPDITCLGKGIALGWPMSMVLADDRIAKAMTPGTHFNSMAGSDFICAMSLAFIRWLDNNLVDHRDRASWVQQRLEAKPWIKSVDGYGYMLAFTPDWDGYNGQDLCKAAQDRGLLICTWRDHGPIRFNPPMNISNHDLEQAFSILDEAHAAVTGGGK
jgi:acetylornithine/N-succinyldiaminopimelate aminotransferase